MAEYQNTVSSSGEMAQRFIEFIMMQAQNAAFMLGQIPHPQTGKPEVNLDMARLLIDQLAMIQEKTQGNLNADESRILAGTLSNLQMAYVEQARKMGAEVNADEPRPEPVEREQPGEQPPQVQVPTGSEAPEGDHKKKFVKSYGS